MLNLVEEKISMCQNIKTVVIYYWYTIIITLTISFVSGWGWKIHIRGLLLSIDTDSKALSCKLNTQWFEDLGKTISQASNCVEKQLKEYNLDLNTCKKPFFNIRR